MKKAISCLMVLIVLLCTCALPIQAQEEPFTIMTHFNTIRKGTAIEDLPGTVEITPDCMTYVDGTLHVFDFAGHPYSGELKPGHTYYMECQFHCVPEFVAPEGIGADNFLRSADSFVRIINFNCYQALFGPLTTYSFVRFTVPGNPWQMITGRIVDWFGKLQSNFAL